MYDLQKGYELAKELYAQYGVDVDKAMEFATARRSPSIAGRGTTLPALKKTRGS